MGDLHASNEPLYEEPEVNLSNTELVLDRYKNNVKIRKTDLESIKENNADLYQEIVSKQERCELQLDITLKNLEGLQKNAYSLRGQNPNKYYKDLEAAYLSVDNILENMPMANLFQHSLVQRLWEQPDSKISGLKALKGRVASEISAALDKFNIPMRLLDLAVGSEKGTLRINQQEFASGFVHGLGAEIGDFYEFFAELGKNPMVVLEQIKNTIVEIDGVVVNLYEYLVDETSKIMQRAEATDGESIPFDIGHFYGRMLPYVFGAYAKLPQVGYKGKMMITFGRVALAQYVAKAPINVQKAYKLCRTLKIYGKPVARTAMATGGVLAKGEQVYDLGDSSVDINPRQLLETLDPIKLTEMLRLQFPLSSPILGRKWTALIVTKLESAANSSLSDGKFNELLAQLLGLNSLLKNNQPGNFDILKSEIPDTANLLKSTLRQAALDANILDSDPEVTKILAAIGN